MTQQDTREQGMTAQDMTDQQMTAQDHGPIDYLAVEFPEARMRGEGLAALLQRLVEGAQRHIAANEKSLDDARKVHGVTHREHRHLHDRSSLTDRVRLLLHLGSQYPCSSLATMAV